MNRHRDQIQEWLYRERKPFPKSLERIERFLEEVLRVQVVQQNSMFKISEHAILLNDQEQSKQG